MTAKSSASDTFRSHRVTSEPRTAPASDGRYCMIYTPARRIVADACLHCRLSIIACQAGREINRQACCTTCDHD